MAKKYHQTRKDKEDESRGMRRHERAHHEREHRKEGGHRSFVTGQDPEVGRNDFSGLPRDCVMEAYPSNRARRGGYLDDTMEGIDAIQTDSESATDRHLSNQK